MNEFLFSYVPGNSIFHSLDPRTKILSFMLISIVIFQSNSFKTMMLIALVILILYILSAIPLNLIYESIKPVLIFLFFIYISHIFFSNGDIIFVVGNLKATYEGLTTGTLIVLKFMYLLIFATFFNATTPPAMTTLAIENFLRPLSLKNIGISSFDIATMIYLSMNFMPLLYENFMNLKDAQISRGLNMKKNPIKTVKCFVIPMIELSIRFTEEIAYAMESRCYQGINRTSLYKLEMKKNDYTILLLLGCYTFFYLKY